MVVKQEGTSFYLWVVVKVQASHPAPWWGDGGEVLKVGGTWLVTTKQGWMSKLSTEPLLKLEGKGEAVFPVVL